MDWLYFYEFNLKKSANFDACARGARAPKFSFSKNHGDLKTEYFFNCAEIFLFTSRTIVKNKIQN